MTDGQLLPKYSCENLFIPSSLTDIGWEIRNIQYDNIFMEEFELVYYMRGLTFNDVESMTGHERKKLHTMLGDYLKEHPPSIFG